MKIRATSREPRSATEMGMESRRRKNCPMPSTRETGRKTTIVVRVAVVIASAISLTVNIILIIVIIWIIPTLGVLISSFRIPEAVNTNGWWTVFANLGSNDWTFENYSTVLSSEGFGNAFLNSLAVTIPATVMPITIAAFAAYAFA